jgi:very-short-patch-repair endonuclease
MHSHLRNLAARQADVVAGWQLREAGWTRKKIEHHVQRRGWRVVHPGVYALTSSPLSRRQLWFAAVLTAPGTYLSHGSAGACWGFHRFDRGLEVVTRGGQGGRRRHGRVLVFHSKALDEDTTRHDGLPITTAARTLIDLAAGLDERRLGRAFRESIRLKHTTARRVLDTLHRHEGRQGTPALRKLARRYAAIPYRRTRSDAEGRALELLHDAGVEQPHVNMVIAGEEADMVWLDRRLIVEIDGPQFHRFPDEDARKTRKWRGAGFAVRRLASGAVYESPAELLALVARYPSSRTSSPTRRSISSRVRRTSSTGLPFGSGSSQSR